MLYPYWCDQRDYAQNATCPPDAFERDCYHNHRIYIWMHLEFMSRVGDMELLRRIREYLRTDMSETHHLLVFTFDYRNSC